MRVVAVYNLKGGVGKTASAVNLAHLAARDHRRTLLWDLDPQGAATYYFRVAPRVKGGGRKLFRGKRRPEDSIRGTDYPRLDLLPADFRYRRLEKVLAKLDKPERRLRALVDPLRRRYDLQIIDCAPSISLMAESIFGGVDALLVPMIPTTLSVRTLEQIADFNRRKGFDLPILPFFTMVDGRKRHHKEVVEGLPEPLPRPLAATIPYASEVERMGVERRPVTAFAPRSRGARAYEALYAEVSERLLS